MESILRVECIPPSKERKDEIPESVYPFAVCIKNIEGIDRKSLPDDFHLQAVLFDKKYGRFVGSFWEGKSVYLENTEEIFNQKFYFYTTITPKDLYLIIELISPSKLRNRLKTHGWLCLPLKDETNLDLDEHNIAHYKLPFLCGSPTCLIPLEKIETKSKKKKRKRPSGPERITTGIEAFLQMSPFHDLSQILHLIPENVLLDFNTKIPGLMSESVKLLKDSHLTFKPQVKRGLTFTLENFIVRLHPSVEEVEREIIKKVHMFLNETSRIPETSSKPNSPHHFATKVTVTQRRVQVAVHNGFCFIQDPDFYHLHIELPATPTASKSLRRATSLGSINAGKEECLILRSDIKLSKIPDDPDMYIAFLLEYVISVPDSPDQKNHLSSPLSKNQTLTIPIAWGVCQLASLKENPSQDIELTSDPVSSPHRILFLRMGKHFELTFSAFSILKQRNRANSIYSEEQTSPKSSLFQSESSPEASMFQSAPARSLPRFKSIADIPMVLQKNDSELQHPSKHIEHISASRKNENKFILQEVTLLPSTLPLVPPQLHSFPVEHSSNFSTFSKMYWDKLSPVLDHHGKPAVQIESSSLYRIDSDLELQGLPQVNEISLQLLALSGLDSQVEVPTEIYFTFQFYRFLPIRTESLCLKQLSENADGAEDKSSLVFALLRKSDRTETPGFQVTYVMDPSELNQNEHPHFLRYLMNQTLHIDLWNGQSLLYFGTVLLPLKYLCRQGKEAVFSLLEQDILNCEYTDESLDQTPSPMKKSLGKLHFRLSNVRHPLNSKALEALQDNEVENESVVFHAIKPKSPSNVSLHTVSKAKLIVETDKEFSKLFSSRNVSGNMSPDPQITEERRRKLARMEAIRRMESHSVEVDEMEHFFNEKKQDLLTIESYIEKNKSEIIQSLLHKSLTSEKTIYPVIGNKSFFEFVIKNPFQDPKRVDIIWKSSNLSLVKDTKLWQKFKSLHGLSQKLNPSKLSDIDSETPSVMLEAQEEIHIPFVYQCVLAQTNDVHSFKAASGHHFSADLLSAVSPLNSMESSIKIRFVTEDPTILAVLCIKVQPLPPSFTHIFKFLSMEHSMFKKMVQITKDGHSVNKFSVLCSRSDVACSIQDQDWEDNVNIQIKAPTKSSGNCSEFYVFIYGDTYQIKPSQTWSVSICPLQRVDLSCMSGQIMRSSLLIRGTHSTNLVRCNSSSQELQLHPSDPFVLSPFAAQELSMNVRSLIPGTKHFQITLVNESLHQILQSWLLVLSCQKPSISKAFQVHLSVGKEAAKRITYTNPYFQNRSYVLYSSHPHLLHLREQQFTISSGSSYLIGLYFIPQDYVFSETVYLYLNDSSDKNEETYCIKLICQ